MIVPFEALRNVITIEDAAGEGALGETFAASREVWASVQYIERLVTNEMGVQLTADTLVIIRPEAGPVAIGSKVTIGSEQYRVTKGFPIPDTHSPSHYELTVRLWGVE